MLFKKTAEIQGIVIAYRRGDLGYVVVLVFKHIHSVCNAQGYDVLHRGGLGKLLEILYEPAG